MTETRLFDPLNKPTDAEKSEIVNFLFENLEEYGDPKKDIEKAINYFPEGVYLIWWFHSLSICWKSNQGCRSNKPHRYGWLHSRKYFSICRCKQTS